MKDSLLITTDENSVEFKKIVDYIEEKLGIDKQKMEEVDLFRLKDYRLIGLTGTISFKGIDKRLMEHVRNWSYGFDKKVFLLFVGPKYLFFWLRILEKYLNRKGVVCIKGLILEKFEKDELIKFCRSVLIRQ